MFYELQHTVNELDNVCFSGGAIGSDTIWGDIADKLGHQVIHWSFPDHKSKVETIELTQDLLNLADDYIRKANKRIQREFPTKSLHTNNLLRRNYYQVLWTDSLYAVTNYHFLDEFEGGTAWAIQMFRDLHPKKHAYVFNPLVNKWITNQSTEWIETNDIPIPTGKWTGIGTRKLNKDIIPELYQVAGLKYP